METTAPLTPQAASPVEPDMDGDLTKVHPNYRTALRFTAVLFSIPFIVAALIVEAAISGETALPSGMIAGPVLLLAIAVIIRLPGRRYFARGYNMGADRIRIVRGIWWHSDTVVPFGRVQHIDVNQGPIERFLEIATLTLHTAGSHNASVHLPGLQEDLAKDLREEIRAHIKRETL